jgi:hypothetical protein
MIDYWLNAAASQAVTLEIIDASSGKVVRHFSSADKPEPVDAKKLNVPTYWLRPARVLSPAAGMHRFIWDLHYPEPDVLEHEYPISAIYGDTPRYPLGAAVLPGKYKIVLTAGRKAYTQSLDLRMDPRVKTSSEDLRRQFELDQKLANSLHLDHEALMQVRNLRAQLKSLATQSAVAKPAADLEGKAAILEGESGGRYPNSPEGRSLTRLNGGFAGILNSLDSADAAPTTHQVAMYEDLQKSLQQQLSAWEQIKSSDLAALNEELKKAGLPIINLSRPVAGESSAAQTTSQDRDSNVE